MSRCSQVIVVVIFASLYLAFASHLPSHQKHSTATEHKYSRAHSLGRGYAFDPRDGWQTVNVSNLSYKYSPRSSNLRRTTKTSAAYSPHSTHAYKAKTATVPHPSHNTFPKKITSTVKQVAGTIKNAWKGLLGIGKPEEVITTWYTGHDLLNPSCWENPKWAPTDNSFACALTQEGWTSKPKCFQFLELCNSPLKCVFVRVVDSCAGCAEGSRHVDITKAAFTELAALEMGVLTVQMRHSTEPAEWDEGLWGPKY